MRPPSDRPSWRHRLESIWRSDVTVAVLIALVAFLLMMALVIGT